MTWAKGTRLGGRRKNPPAEVGDVYGTRTVTKILHRDSTSNERVAWRCACGATGQGYVFNLRKANSCLRCWGGKRATRTSSTEGGKDA